MSVMDYNYSSSLKKLEKDDKIQFIHFNNKVAWDLIDTVRTFDLKGHSIMVSIRLFNGIVMNECLIGDNEDNEITPSLNEDIIAKYNTVQKFHMSTYRYGQMLLAKNYNLNNNEKGSEISEKLKGISNVYYFHYHLLHSLLVEEEEYELDADIVTTTLKEIRDKYSKFLFIPKDNLIEFILKNFPSSIHSKEDNIFKNLRWKSSNEKMNVHPTKVMEERTHLKYPNYSSHGGGIPIRLKGLNSPIGVMIVTGFPNGLYNHKICFKALLDVIESQ